MKVNPNNKGGRSPHKGPKGGGGGGGLKQLQHKGKGGGSGNRDGFIGKSKNFKNKFNSPGGGTSPGGGGGKFRGKGDRGGGGPPAKGKGQGFNKKGSKFNKGGGDNGNVSFGGGGGAGGNKNKPGNRNKKNKYENKSTIYQSPGRRRGGGGFKKPDYDPNTTADSGDDSNSDEEEPSNPNFIQVKRQDKKNKVGDDEELEIATMSEQFKSFKDIKTFDEDEDEEDSEDEDDFIKGGAGVSPGPGDGVGTKGSKKKTGGFQSMGLSDLVLKGVLRRGYKVPTPIQRKTIPLILEGRDVVAMARTGSGKTAAFLIPLFEKLHVNKTEIGSMQKFPRALILSPTRELAMQTVKFFKEIGRFVNLKVATILGGDSMESQFQIIHDKPDVVIATPGRFMHLCVEMEMKLDGIQYIVYDEADRLFEMGFGEQVSEIVRRLPESRQTVLFSATLPKLLVEFTKAGLHDPSLIRLDVDSKLPEMLKLTYLACRSEDKTAALLHLIKNLIDQKQQTIVFAATKHHVEFIHQLFDEENISNCYIYSSLDPAARKISIAKFRSGKCNVMVVTDIAARGIDIPILDNVINYHFPAKPKLFMHRVGRVARAGRSGVAYSIIAPDEVAFLLDLHLFLNRPLKFSNFLGDDNSDSASVLVGRMPQDLLNEENGIVSNILTIKAEMDTLHNTCRNGYSQYLKSRPSASTESNRRAKDIQVSRLPIHPIFARHVEADPMDTLISQINTYRPHSTIFEIGPKSSSETYNIMKIKRSKDQRAVEKYRTTKSNAQSIYGIGRPDKLQKKDEENFIPYLPKDHLTETGLSVGTTFDKQIQESVMDITGDDSDMLKAQRSIMKWDQKKKKYVSTGKDLKAKKIKTESGAWISASYKSDRYKVWQDRSKVLQQSEPNSDEYDSDGGDDFTKKGSNPAFRSPAFSKRLVKTGKNDGPSASAGGTGRKKGVKFNTELKRPEQILKDRKVKEKKRLKSQSPKGKGKGKGGRGGGGPGGAKGGGFNRGGGGGGNRKKK